MKLMHGIEMLEISTNIMGSPSIIYPTLMVDKDSVILVDTGFPGQLPQLRKAVEKAGVSFDRLTTIILTHHDIDHIGGLTTILKELPGQVTTLAHSQETAYIQGEKTPLKLAQLEASLNSKQDERSAFYEKLKTAFLNSYARIDQTLTDGEILPYCGGVTVIHTPGHTLGHICLYHKQSKTLVAGDALCVEDGILTKAPASTNYDADLCKKSLKKLAKFDIETIICYHGGLFQDNPNQRIAALADEL